jgi:hypothetical protein
MSTISILSKITVKSVGSRPANAAETKQREMLMRVYGVASDLKISRNINERSGEKDVALKGDFRAINLKTGERFSSGLLYLPAGIHDLIQAPLDIAKANNETAEVTFALDVFSQPASNPSGFSYGATVLGEPTENDAVARIEADISKVAPLQIAAAEPEAKSAKAK